MTAETCCFAVTGDAITQIVRDLVLEGRHQVAIRVLESGVPDMPLGAVAKLLSGELRLSGDNEVTLEPETPEVRAAYAARLQYAYGGVVIDGLTAWRPYAIVTAYNADDVPGRSTPENKHAPSGFGLAGKRVLFAYARTVYYADDPVNDRSVTCFVPNIGHCNVLWSQVHDLPSFVVSATDWQAGLAAYLSAGCHLQRRGAGDTVKDTFAESDGEHRHFDAARTDESTSFIRDLAVSAGVNSELAAGLFGPGPAVAERTGPADAKYGWLSPHGEMYGCLYGQHSKLAALLKPDESNPDNALELGGWIKFAFKTNAYPEGYVFARRHPTADQHKTLEDWAAYHALNLSELLGSQCT